MIIAKDLMTRDVVAVPPDMAVATVARVLAEAGISAVPVADEAHRVIGRTTGREPCTASPEAMDAVIISAPVGALLPAALRAIRPGGTMICTGTHMSDIPSFPYSGWSACCAWSPASRGPTAKRSWRWRLACRCERR